MVVFKPSLQENELYDDIQKLHIGQPKSVKSYVHWQS